MSMMDLQVKKKINRPSTNGTAGQVLSTNGDGSTSWINVGQPTDAQTAQAVSDWLDNHPEATTTVEDGAITRAKLNEDLQEKTDCVPEMSSALEEYVYIKTEGERKNEFSKTEMQQAGIFSINLPSGSSDYTEYAVFQEDLCPPLDSYYASSVPYSKRAGNTIEVNGTIQSAIDYYGTYNGTGRYTPLTEIDSGDTVFMLITVSGSFTPAGENQTDMIKPYINNYDSGGTNRAQIQSVMSISESVKIISATVPADIAEISVWIKFYPGVYDNFKVRWFAYKNEVVKEYLVSGGLSLKSSDIGTNGIAMLPVDGAMETFVNTKTYIDNKPYYITPKKFGAAGNGTTDDSNAVQAAFDYAGQHKVPLYVSDGIYYINNIELKNGYTYEVFGTVVPRPDWNVGPAKGFYIKKNTCGFIGLSSNSSTSFDTFPRVRMFMKDVTIKGEDGSVGYPTVFKDIVFTDSTFDNVNATFLGTFIDGAVVGNSLITNCKILAVHNSVFKAFGCTYGAHNYPDFTDSRIQNNYFAGLPKGLGNLYFPTVFDTPAGIYNNFFSHNFIANMWAIVGVTDETNGKPLLEGWNSNNNIYSFTPYFAWNKIPNDDTKVSLYLCNINADNIWYAGAEAIEETAEGRAYFDDYSNEPRITSEEIHFLSCEIMTHCNVMDLVLRKCDTLLEDITKLRGVNLMKVVSFVSSSTAEQGVHELTVAAHAFDTKMPLSDYNDNLHYYEFNNIPSWSGRTVDSLPTIQDSNYRYVLEGQTCYYDNTLYICHGNKWYDTNPEAFVTNETSAKNTFSATELNSLDNFSIESDATGYLNVLVSKAEDICPLTDAFTSSSGVIYKDAGVNVVTADGTPASNTSFYSKVNNHAYITPKGTISAGDTAYFSFSVDGTITGSGTTPGRGEFVFKYTDESTETIHVDFGMSGGLASGSLTAAKDVQYIYVTFLFRKDYTFDVNITWAVSKVAFSNVSVPSDGVLKFSETDVGNNGFTIIPTVAIVKHKIPVKDYIEDYVDNHIPEGMLVKKDLVYISPEMYGAKGDGVTDDTTALQACVNAAKLNIASDVPKIPIRGYGKYKITSGITVIGSYMDIQLNSIMFANGTYAEDSCAVKVTGRNNLIRINYINAYDAVNVGAFRLETSPNVTDNCQYNEIYLGIIYGNTNGVEYVNDYGSYTDGSGQTQMKTIYYNRLYINSNIARYGNCFYFRGTIGGCMNENSFWAKRLTSYNNYAIYNDGWTGTDSHRFYDVCIESSCANGVYGYASLINARTTECMDLKRYPDALNKGDIFTFNGITAEGGLCLGSTMIDYESVNVSNAKSFEQALASIQYRYDELNLTKAQAITPLLPGNPVLGNAFRFWDYYAVPSERQGPATLMRGKIIVYYNRKGFVPDHDWETTITVSDYTPLVTEIKIPTIFNIGANTTIHLDDSYCCIGVNKIKIIQQNDYKATVYDKDNNLIFDGTGQPDGTYCLNCELVNYSFSFVSERTGRTVTYDTDISGRFYGPNEKWTVEKLNIISAT